MRIFLDYKLGASLICNFRMRNKKGDFLHYRKALVVDDEDDDAIAAHNFCSIIFYCKVMFDYGKIIQYTFE